MAAALDALTQNGELLAWLRDVVELCRPENVYTCDGSQEEYEYMCDLLVKQGTFTRLNESLRPGCYLARSHPSDVARVEDRTYICTDEQVEAGPTNNWAPAREMKLKMGRLFNRCMEGRTMYIIPFSMGPVGSPFSQIGIEVTDSPYVVANMMIMTRVGTEVLEALGKDGKFIPCLHTVGAPLAPFQGDVPWPCERDPKHKYIVHFPDDPVHLVVRVRLRRQRAAGQEVPGSAHRLGDGPQGGLAGRAHAHPGSDVTRGQEALHRRSLPQRLRQDQSGHDAAHAARLDGDHHRRRHRLDAHRRRRPSLRHEPRDRLLRGGAGNVVSLESQRHGYLHPQQHLHQRGPHRRRRRLVGGHGRGCPGPPHRLGGQRLDARLGSEGRPSQLALHRSGRAVPGDRPRLAEPGRRAHLGLPLRRPAGHYHTAGERGLRLGARSVHGLRRRFRDHGCRSRPSRSAAPRPVRHAALLRLQHGRLLLPLAVDGRADRRGQAAARVLRQLVPQGRGRPLAVARLRREQPGAQVDLRARGRRRPGCQDPHRHICRRPKPSISPASICRRTI